MTAVDQAVTVLEGLAGKELTNSQMLKAVKYFIDYRDSEGLNNEQIAQKFIDQLVTKVKTKIKQGATRQATEDNLSAVQSAVADAVSDL